MTFEPVQMLQIRCDGQGCKTLYLDYEDEVIVVFNDATAEKERRQGQQFVSSGNEPGDLDITDEWLFNVDFHLCPECRHAVEQTEGVDRRADAVLAEAQKTMTPIPGVDEAVAS